MDPTLKHLSEWVCSHYHSHKTYCEDDDPRGAIFPCMLLRVAISNLLTSSDLTNVARESLVEKQNALTTIQKGMTQLFTSYFSIEEYNLMVQFPIVWMLTILSNGENQEVVKLLKLSPPPPFDCSLVANNPINSTLKKLSDWVCAHYISLRTYCEEDDPRGSIFPCMLLRVAISNILNSRQLSCPARDKLMEKQMALTNIQKGVLQLFKASFSVEETRMINQYPIVWMLTLLSDHGNEQVMQVLNVVPQPPFDEVD